MSVSLIDGHIDDDAPGMTDNEIIKALGYCIKGDVCENCPYFTRRQRYECGEHFNKDVLDLINRQKAEIERLEERDETAEKIIREQADKILDLQADNSRLTDRNSVLSARTDSSIIACVSARVEAITEFAERLHCHCQSIINEEWNKKVYPNSWADAYEEFDEVVDNLVIEMVGAENG